MTRLDVDIWLDTSRLDAAIDEARWRSFLSFVASCIGRPVSIHSFSGILPDDGGEFVFVVDSAALSRKLLLNFSRLYLQPTTGPVQVDSWLFFRALGDPAVAALGLQRVQRNVTLMSSVFRGDLYLTGFLENSACLDAYAECEHLLIRAASPGKEHVGLIEHVRAYPSAVYVNLASDPGLYEVWNLGVRLATGGYLSNANIDDRRAPGQVAHLCRVLDTQPQVDVASTALRISTEKNLPWAASGQCHTWFAELGDQIYGAPGLFRQSREGLASRNLPHCMPLWRRSLHSLNCGFDEKRYGPSADWAFWLHAARRGSLFHFSAQPMGLYFHDESTYWRRNTHQSDGLSPSDARIVAEFGALTRAGSDSEISPWPVALDINSALMWLESGAFLDGFIKVLDISARNYEAESSVTELLNLIFWHYFGCREWKKLVRSYAAWCSQSPLDAQFNALADLVHGFVLTGNENSASCIATAIELACFDWFESRRDVRGLLLAAVLARRFGRFDEERNILRSVHGQDGFGFWARLQAAYRFCRPLSEICADVLPFGQVGYLDISASNLHLVYFPDYSRTNDYQNLLYEDLCLSGADIHGTSDLEKFISTTLVPGGYNVLHIHWTNPFFKRTGLDKLATGKQFDTFLVTIRQKKALGFKIFWTVHNNVSHESVDPVAECDFQKALYAVADRVFVHHPMVPYLVDWLPDHDKLALCEHGAYDREKAGAFSKADARKLLGLSDESFIFTHVGQVRDYKGLANVLPLIAEYLSSIPRAIFLIAGKIISQEVRDLLNDLRHPQIVVIDRFLSDDELTACMRASDLGLLCHSAILTSGTLFHWLSSDRPVIAPRAGTLQAYLVDGWNGILYDEPDEIPGILNFFEHMAEGDSDVLGENSGFVAVGLQWKLLNSISR